MFLTIHFKHFVGLCCLNSNSKNLFGRSSISNFSVDTLVSFLVHSVMCVYIWFISLFMSKSVASGLVLTIAIP